MHRLLVMASGRISAQNANDRTHRHLEITCAPFGFVIHRRRVVRAVWGKLFRHIQDPYDGKFVYAFRFRRDDLLAHWLQQWRES